MAVVSQRASLSNWVPDYSQLDIDSIPDKYNTQGKLEDIYTDSANNTSPTAVDYFLNTNANGFTIQNPIGVSQFIGINGTTYVHPNGLNAIGTVDYFANTNANGFVLNAQLGISNFVDGGQTSIYGFPGTLPAPTDFFLNTHAKGFTIKNPVGETQFIGVGGAGTTYTNPSGLNALRNVNYFSDPFSGAEGFKDRPAVLQSYYLGISPDQTKYQYPQTVQAARLMNVRLGQGAGTAKLENQLGAGSKMGNTGFYAENRYAEAVRNDSNQSLLASWALRRRSPSPLEQQYSKFKLRDEAFNPTFIGHPLILRGLQNPDVLGPQRWGLDALGQQESRTAANNLAAALDGGFIRGGASTAAERSAIDTARLTKFMASPRGLVWSITQVGLGKSNIRPHGAMSYEEIALATQNPLPLLNNTQTHLGITSLLSVPGSAFGLHFTRHGIPFLNEVASYEYVLKSFTRAESEVPGTMFHKHIRLKDELLNVDRNNFVSVGSPISNLSYTGGPQSVYGLGSTQIKRATDTLEGWRRYKPISYPDPVDTKALPQRPNRASSTITQDASGQTVIQNNKAQTRYLDKRAAIIEENKAIISANFAASQAVDNINKRLAALDLELSPWYNFTRRYAPSFNNNKTVQASTAEDKQVSALDSAFESDFLNPDSIFGLKHYLKRVATTNTNIENINFTPGDGKLGDPQAPQTVISAPKFDGTDDSSPSGNKFATLPYAELRRLARNRRNATSKDINDFRTGLVGDWSTFSTDPSVADYANNNLEKRYGFGTHGRRDHDRSDPYSNGGENNIDYAYDLLKNNNHKTLAENPKFRGDKITATDYIPSSNATTLTDIYPKDTRDFIKFYFSGPELVGGAKDDIIVFRATIKGLSDTFSPGWNPIQIMGRPDGPALYSSFERNISFNFMVAASTREELIPMWRKLNYLSTYTMPIYGGGRPGGVLARLTIGDMFNQTPGYFTGLTITVNDEATWDLADDLTTDSTSGAISKSNKAKQLPNLVDVDVQFKIIHDWRPQKGGRSYSLYSDNFASQNASNNWLWDSNL